MPEIIKMGIPADNIKFVGQCKTCHSVVRYRLSETEWIIGLSPGSHLGVQAIIAKCANCETDHITAIQE